MNILLVTGQLAEPIVKRYAKMSPAHPIVISLPFAVAALMTPKYISRELKIMNVKDFDLILVPGEVRGDVSLVSDVLGIPTSKGPRHAADIPLVIIVVGTRNTCTALGRGSQSSRASGTSRATTRTALPRIPSSWTFRTGQPSRPMVANMLLRETSTISGCVPTPRQ